MEVAQKLDFVPICELSNFKLVSLLDMLRFYAEQFTLLTNYFSKASATGYKLNTLKENEVFLKSLKELYVICEAVGLEYSARQISRIVGVIENDTYQSKPNATCTDLITDLEGRVFDELSVRACMIVSRTKADFYEQNNLFGDEVFNKFPSANFDIEEAGKCFALARDTACVMHLMRCLEVALKAIGVALNVPNAVNSNWQTIIDQVNSFIKKKKSIISKVESDFYTNAIAHLSTIKNAWRNPTMHIERKYIEEEAEDIFNAVKGFMRHLAKHLDEKGNFTP